MVLDRIMILVHDCHTLYVTILLSVHCHVPDLPLAGRPIRRVLGLRLGRLLLPRLRGPAGAYRPRRPADHAMQTDPSRQPEFGQSGR